MEVRKGYRQTEIGRIPEDWDVKAFGEVASVRKQKLAAQVVSMPLFYVELDNIEQGSGKLIGDKEIINIVSMKSVFHEGDVLFGKLRAYLRKYWLADRDGVCSTEIWPLVAKPSLITEKYLIQLVRTEKFIEVATMAYGTHMPRTDWNVVKNYIFPLPPLPEQHLIAAALSDVDDLLTALDNLIAKKQLIKLGAMQELLMGKKHLPGFSGEWRWKTFGDVISSCFSGATPSRSRPDYFKGNILWITSTELNYNVITDTNEKITAEAMNSANLKMLPKKTFLMAITGLEAEGTRGRCGIVGEEATTNQSCMALFPTNELSVDYLFYYYVFAGDKLAFQNCQGTKQQSYTAQTVKLLPIYLPPVPEQTAIVEVLSDMDVEIAALEVRREKTRLLKQGMMQVLLTGRIRLL